MKQAIDEGFIIDVLKYYTPVASYYRLEAVVEDDPMFDRERRKEASQVRRTPRSRNSIEGGNHGRPLPTVRFGSAKIGGKARAMVICSGIPEAVQHYRCIKTYLRVQEPPKPIVAFSGETDVEGQIITESQLNGFPSD